jgi:hypothetical protein
VDLLPHQQSSFLQELQKGTDANEDIPLPVMKSFVASEHAVLSVRCGLSQRSPWLKNFDPRMMPKK